jgi:hypothetical protein
MFVLFVEMKLKPGAQAGGDWRLSIAFESHDLQKKWVALDLHQVVWPQMQNYFADFSVNDYTSV